MKIALYARISTDDQRADLQLDALRRYADDRNITIFKEYIDHFSGAKATRPALDEMLADARRRKFDAVAVWKIDRLGRSVQHLLSVLTELQTLKIAFISLQEAIDTTSPAGRMVFTFLGAVAEFERAIIGERVRAGMAAAKRRGKHCGRNSIKLNADQICTMRTQGKSLRDIATILGTSHQTVANVIRTSRHA